MIPPDQVHSSKINGAVVNLRAKGDKLGVSQASTINVKGISFSGNVEKLKEVIIRNAFSPFAKVWLADSSADSVLRIGR